MEILTPWMVEGAIVELTKNSLPVGKAKILSVDAKRTCHNVELGPDHALVSLMDVFDDSIELENGEKLVDMMSSFLIWKKLQIREVRVDSLPDQQQSSIHHAEEIPITGSPPLSDSSEENSNGHGGTPKVKIPKAMWMGMIVKVMDDASLVFAKATIQVLDPMTKLGEIVLGDTHIGILFYELIEGASQDHLKYRDCLHPWPIDKLIASDGILLAFHQEQDVGLAKSNDVKRRYVRIKRIHKSPSSLPSTKEKALSKDGIRMLSTKDCCSQRCCQHFNIDLVKTIRERYWSKSYELRKEEQINTIVNTVHLASGERVVVLEGTTICLEAWRQIHFLGKSRFYETKNAVTVGVRIPTHGNKGKRRMSERVSQAYMAMQVIIDELADNHLAKLRTMADGSCKVLRELPTNFTWESIRNKANAENIELGLAPVSQSTVSLLRQTYFKEVAIHKKGNNFSKCTTCSELLQRKSHLTGVKEEIESLKRDEDAHHEEHSQGRLLYHAWRHESIHRPKEVLCIIHDKMDHCKTAIPRIPFVPKSVDSAQKFPITLTGILTHGHGPRAIAQYSVGVWAPGLNTTIGSLDSILRMLENPTPMINSLLHGPDSTDLFETLLLGRGPTLEVDVFKAFEEDLQTITNIESKCASPTSAVTNMPMPWVLKLQLDNCSGHNKNRYVMAYLSLLTAREVFEEIHMGFLIVGHTHEDVDAKFGHFSEALMHHPAFTLPELMSLLFRASKPNAVPHFVQEVLDFKNFVEPYILKGPDTLVGHLQPCLFRFYVHHDKMPCFQYKLKSMDDHWLPEGGIEIWSWTSDNCPHLPIGVPKRLPMVEMKMLDDVIEGLQKHIKFIQLIISRSPQEAKVQWEAFVAYWQRIITILENDEVQYRQEDGDAMVQGFWPVSNWRDHVPTIYRNFACELEAKTVYVGPRRGKPQDCFSPLVDIVKGLFVLIRPDTKDMSTYPVYLGKVVGDIVLGEINEKDEQEHVCEVEWWRPYMQKKRRKKQWSPAERYLECWTKKWEQDPSYTKSKIKITTVLWCFKPRKNAKRNVFKIAKSHATKALDNLKRCIEDEARGKIADVDIEIESEDDMEE